MINIYRRQLLVALGDPSPQEYEYLLELRDETGELGSDVAVAGSNGVAIIIRYLSQTYEQIEVHNHTNEPDSDFGIGNNVAPFASAS